MAQPFEGSLRSRSRSALLIGFTSSGKSFYSCATPTYSAKRVDSGEGLPNLLRIGQPRYASLGAHLSTHILSSMSFKSRHSQSVREKMADSLSEL